MSITLTRFSQEVDVTTGSMDVTYFAVFQASDGRELKLPISQTASQTLIEFMADKQQKKEASADEEPPQAAADEMVMEEALQHATTFGEYDQDEAYDGDADEVPDEAPESEGEVPSL